METHALYDFILTQSPEKRQLPFGAPIGIAPGGGSKTASEGRFALNWRKYTNEVWVSGTDYQNRPNEVHHTTEDLRRLLLRDGNLPIIIQQEDGLARHTPDQAEWLAHQVLRNKTCSLILSTAEYHLPRFALTVCASFLKLGVEDAALAIIPTSQTEVVSDSATSQTVEEEIKRIEIYQNKGDVATWEQAKKFFR